MARQLRVIVDASHLLDSHQPGYIAVHGTKYATGGFGRLDIRADIAISINCPWYLWLWGCVDLLEDCSRSGCWSWKAFSFAEYFQRASQGSCCSIVLSYSSPQSSVGSLTLFNVAVLGRLVNRYELQCFQYADETQLCISIPSDPDKTSDVSRLGK